MKDNQIGQQEQVKQAEPCNTLGLCSRQSAKGVLDDLIFRKERDVNNLKVIRDLLPTKLTPEQDDALFNQFISQWPR